MYFFKEEEELNTDATLEFNLIKREILKESPRFEYYNKLVINNETYDRLSIAELDSAFTFGMNTETGEIVGENFAFPVSAELRTRIKRFLITHGRIMARYFFKDFSNDPITFSEFEEKLKGIFGSDAVIMISHDHLGKGKINIFRLTIHYNALLPSGESRTQVTFAFILNILTGEIFRKKTYESRLEPVVDWIEQFLKEHSLTLISNRRHHALAAFARANPFLGMSSTAAIAAEAGAEAGAGAGATTAPQIRFGPSTNFVFRNKPLMRTHTRTMPRKLFSSSIKHRTNMTAAAPSGGRRQRKTRRRRGSKATRRR